MFTLQLVQGVNNSCLPYPKQLLREKQSLELEEKDKTTTGIWRHVNDYHFKTMKRD